MVVLSYMKGAPFAGPFSTAVATIYPGCMAPTMSGRAICATAAFADLFALGLVIGLVYNRLPIRV